MAIVKHKKHDTLYRYLGEDKYRNLQTGVEGLVEPALAKEIFVINLDATEMCNQNPNIEKLIKELKLKIETPTRSNGKV